MSMRSMIDSGIRAQMAVTSPPYWGLRSYCPADHPLKGLELGLETVHDCFGWAGGGSRCGECYICHQVEVFALVRDLLTKDGTLWLNIGDSYSSGGRLDHGPVLSDKQASNRGANVTERPGLVTEKNRNAGREGKSWRRDRVPTGGVRHITAPGLKEKDLGMIPARLAMALQHHGCADWQAVRTLERVRAELEVAYEGGGMPDRVLAALERLDVEFHEAKGSSWYLRQDIIWHKTSAMPESVTDRCTKAHEYVFLLSKSESYFFDAKSIAVPLAQASIDRMAQPSLAQQIGSERQPGRSGRTMKTVGDIEGAKRLKAAPRFGGSKYGDNDEAPRTKSGNEWESPKDGLANRRDVWSLPAAPYKGAHLATYPPRLVELCILAGSRTGDLVFDPFIGSGTTGQVAQKLGRRWLGCELNEAYDALQRERTGQHGLELHA